MFFVEEQLVLWSIKVFLKKSSLRLLSFLNCSLRQKHINIIVHLQPFAKEQCNSNINTCSQPFQLRLPQSIQLKSTEKFFFCISTAIFLFSSFRLRLRHHIVPFDNDYYKASQISFKLKML